MADISIHGVYQLLRDPCGIAVRRAPDRLTLTLPWGPLTEAFLGAYNAIQADNPTLTPAAVLELLWPTLEPEALRDN